MNLPSFFEVFLILMNFNSAFSYKFHNFATSIFKDDGIRIQRPFKPNAERRYQKLFN